MLTFRLFQYYIGYVYVVWCVCVCVYSEFVEHEHIVSFSSFATVTIELMFTCSSVRVVEA